MILDKNKFEITLARLGMSQKDFVERSGVSKPTIAHLKKGGEVRPATAGRIAKALRVDISELIKEG